MIGDLNETLKQLFIDRIPLDPREVEIVFEAPNHEWSATVATPTINCYLYHIQENLALRSYDWERQNAGDRGLASRKRVPSRMELHYVISVWSTEVEDEHRLLWRILSVLMRYKELPVSLLKGDLGKTEWPIPVAVAQPETALRNPSDFWSTFEQPMKPGISCAFTLPLDPELVITAPPVLTRHWRVRPLNGPADSGNFDIAGYLLAAPEDRQGLPGQRVYLLERGLFRETDRYGRFHFERIPPGRYTLETQIEGRTVQQPVTVPDRNYDLVVNPEAAARAGAGKKGG
jgi:hypothetical protein